MSNNDSLNEVESITTKRLNISLKNQKIDNYDSLFMDWKKSEPIIEKTKLGNSPSTASATAMPRQRPKLRHTNSIDVADSSYRRPIETTATNNNADNNLNQTNRCSQSSEMTGNVKQSRPMRRQMTIQTMAT